MVATRRANCIALAGTTSLRLGAQVGEWQPPTFRCVLSQVQSCCRMPVWRLHAIGWQHIVQGPQGVGEGFGRLRLLCAQQDTCTPKGNLDALHAAALEA